MTEHVVRRGDGYECTDPEHELRGSCMYQLPGEGGWPHIHQARDADLGQARAERDGAYRERALLAALYPAVLAPAPDVEDDGWRIVYLDLGGRQCSWHIAPADTGLFGHVPQVGSDDPRAQWDGHSTAEKYQRIAEVAAERSVSGLYFCPTAGEVESAAHGGFDVCCDRPGLHLPMPDSPATAAVSAALSEAAKAAYRVAKVRAYCEALAGGSCRVQAAVTARDVLDLLDGRLGAEDEPVPPAAGSGADGEQRHG